VQESLERLGREQPLIAGELAFLGRQIDEVLAQTEENGRALERLEEENQQRQQRVEEHQQNIDRIVTARRDAQNRLTDLKVELGQLTEKRAATAEAIGAVQRGIMDLESALAAAQADKQRAQARVDEAGAAVCAGREAVEKLTASATELETQATQLRAQREALRAAVEELHENLKSTRVQLEDAEARLHQSQMSLAQATVHRDNLSARVREELGVDLAERMAGYLHREDRDWTQVEAEIAELRQKMERLGHVNLDAIAELKELEERFEFLSSQRHDLTESRRQLEQLIAQLNEESKERFRATLDQIREHFRGLFRRLFGGGRADIILEDPEQLLECGIEIVAQPPGKDLQVISLMSGGEKSMTAIALLMSIFKCRPAPFAILDEVDAALDEANNERFNRILREFVQDVQFIVITHSKWTMNIADRLYGITMQEPGVSTRVSVEFSKVNAA
jgi:chromosome segregation protein